MGFGDFLKGLKKGTELRRQSEAYKRAEKAAVKRASAEELGVKLGAMGVMGAIREAGKAAAPRIQKVAKESKRAFNNPQFQQLGKNIRASQEREFGHKKKK